MELSLQKLQTVLLRAEHELIKFAMMLLFFKIKNGEGLDWPTLSTGVETLKPWFAKETWL